MTEQSDSRLIPFPDEKKCRCLAEVYELLLSLPDYSNTASDTDDEKYHQDEITSENSTVILPDVIDDGGEF